MTTLADSSIQDRRRVDEPQPSATAGHGDRRSRGVDLCKIVAALAVFTYHFALDYRLETGKAWVFAGLKGPLLAALGSWGVCVFVTVSGLTLGWSYAQRPCGLPYWRARLRRIYPTYLWVAVPLTGLAAVAGTLARGDYWKAPIWWSGLSFVSPATFFPVVDSWWYIGLALQLYVAFAGFMWLVGRRGGLVVLAAISAIAPFVYTFVLPRSGSAGAYLSCWFVGLSYVTLFCFGFLLSRLLKTLVPQTPRSVPKSSLVASLVLVCGSLIVMALLRGTWATQLAAAGFALLLVSGGRGGPGRRSAFTSAVAWLAGLTFVFYLAHSPWAKPVMKALARGGITDPWLAYAACLAVALTVSLCFWMSLKWVTGGAGSRARWHDASRELGVSGEGDS